MESLNPRYRLLIRLECAAAVALHVGLVWLLRIPVGHYRAMYAGFGLMWSAMQYVHHYGTVRHVTRGARNLWIWKPLDLMWLTTTGTSRITPIRPCRGCICRARMWKEMRSAGFCSQLI